MRIFEFLHVGKAVSVKYQIPKTDLKMLKSVALREHADTPDVLRAILRSFMFEYRRFEEGGKELPSVWLRHEPADAEKMIRVHCVFAATEAAELSRIASIESGRKGMKLSAPAIVRAVLRAFVIAQKKANEANRPVESADLVRVFRGENHAA